MIAISTQKNSSLPHDLGALTPAAHEMRRLALAEALPDPVFKIAGHEYALVADVLRLLFGVKRTTPNSPVQLRVETGLHVRDQLLYAGEDDMVATDAGPRTLAKVKDKRRGEAAIFRAAPYARIDHIIDERCVWYPTARRRIAHLI